MADVNEALVRSVLQEVLSRIGGSASSASAVAVLQATTIALISCVFRKRTICLEYRSMVWRDLLP